MASSPIIPVSPSPLCLGEKEWLYQVCWILILQFHEISQQILYIKLFFVFLGRNIASAGLKPGAPSSGGNKDNFVICEICDGYIRDLEQLRNHMQFIHKVKIHPKMIYNRPPLNCQKCQFRFFTDQVRNLWHLKLIDFFFNYFTTFL